MTINHDRSDSSVLTTCTQCPYWFSFQLNMPAAYRSAATHLELVHDVEAVRALAPLRLYEKRHAADS